jgi:hypothetical protein
MGQRYLEDSIPGTAGYSGSAHFRRIKRLRQSRVAGEFSDPPKGGSMTVRIGGPRRPQAGLRYHTGVGGIYCAISTTFPKLLS